MKADLIATRQAILNGEIHPQAVAEACLDQAQSAACKDVFLQLTPETLLGTAGQVALPQKTGY